MIQNSIRRLIFGFLITRSLPALADSSIPQRGMLARLAAHINAGQMAAVGLGAGGEAAIVIDDNCTVSMVLEHRQLHNCHNRLLTREPRSCELGLSSDDCTTHKNDISNERDGTGLVATAAMGPGRSRRQKLNVEIVVSSRRAVGVYGEFWPTNKAETSLFL